MLINNTTAARTTITFAPEGMKVDAVWGDGGVDILFTQHADNEVFLLFTPTHARELLGLLQEISQS